MSDAHKPGDWPTTTTPATAPLLTPSTVSDNLAKELKLQRQRRMPTLVALVLGAFLAAGAFALFAGQQGSFVGAGARIDEELTGVKSTTVAAGQRAAASTGDAARLAGANIDDAIERATQQEAQSNATKPPTPQN